MAFISECIWPLSHHVLQLNPMKLILQQTVLYPPPWHRGLGQEWEHLGLAPSSRIGRHNLSRRNEVAWWCAVEMWQNAHTGIKEGQWGYSRCGSTVIGHVVTYGIRWT